MAPTIGLVGCGAWGRFILRDLVELGAAVTVVARSEESAERARDGKARGVVSDVASLPDVDGVIVATPLTTHAAVIDQLLPRGVPIYCEKALSNDPDAAARLAETAGDRLFVMDKWRYHPGVETLRDVAASGELGEVIGLESIRRQVGNPHRDTDAIWVLAPHDLAIALEILGHVPEPRAAVAEHAHAPDADEPVVIGIRAILGPRPERPVGRVPGDPPRPPHPPCPWLTLDVSGRHDKHVRGLTLVARGGVARLDDAYSDAVEIRRGGEPRRNRPLDVERRPIPAEMPLRKELTAFLDHLGGGPPPKSSAADAARIVATIGELRRLAGVEP